MFGRCACALVAVAACTIATIAATEVDYLITITGTY
jgi:hypothetical protein